MWSRAEREMECSCPVGEMRKAVNAVGKQPHHPAPRPGLADNGSSMRCSHSGTCGWTDTEPVHRGSFEYCGFPTCRECLCRQEEKAEQRGCFYNWKKGGTQLQGARGTVWRNGILCVVTHCHPMWIDGTGLVRTGKKSYRGESVSRIRKGDSEASGYSMGLPHTESCFHTNAVICHTYEQGHAIWSLQASVRPSV